MSKGIREGTKITFSDGKEREVFPLSIRNLRKVMKVMGNMEDMGSMTDENITVLLDAARVILDKVDPKLVAASNEAVEKRNEFSVVARDRIGLGCRADKHHGNQKRHRQQRRTNGARLSVSVFALIHCCLPARWAHRRTNCGPLSPHVARSTHGADGLVEGRVYAHHVRPRSGTR